jgi:hypothetical protein
MEVESDVFDKLTRRASASMLNFIFCVRFSNQS